MEAFKINVKLFAREDTFTANEFIPVFHRWIQTQAMPNHLMIDVAYYAHVPDGPSTVLITYEANVVIDRGQGRMGVLYARKQPTPGTFAERLKAVVVETLLAAAKLEEAPELSGRLKFQTDEIVIRLNDRLRAPNTPQTFAEVKGDIEALAGELFAGKEFDATDQPDRLRVFEVILKSDENAGVSTLLERLGVSTVTA